MINYNKSIIYKICCNDLKIKEIYIGSTINFTRRKQRHKSCCNNINGKNYNLKLYKCIRDNGGWVNWSMILIDTVSCESKLELLKIEREYIEKNNSVLNCKIPSRTKKEYNKEYIKQYREVNKEYDSEYYQKNKAQIKEKNKEKMTCECGSTFRKRDKARHEKTKKHIEFKNNKK